MPLSSDGNELVIALVDPFNHDPVRAIAFLTGRETILRIIASAEFDAVFESLYVGSDANAKGTEPTGGGEASDIAVQRLRDMASVAPLIRPATQLTTNAVEV